jgi:MFS family permease
MGLGIGQTTVVAPAYLAEAAPRSIRGLCICIFSGSVYLGIMLGYFANWGTSLHVSNHSSKQWIDASILHILFAGIILVMSIFALESPRWLAKVGRDEDAATNMSKLRQLPVDHPYVRAELIDIHDQIEREREATLGSGFFGPLKELFLLPSNRYRIFLGLGCQLLGRTCPPFPTSSPKSTDRQQQNGPGRTQSPSTLPNSLPSSVRPVNPRSSSPLQSSAL